jgi:hypothetical protein
MRNLTRVSCVVRPPRSPAAYSNVPVEARPRFGHVGAASPFSSSVGPTHGAGGLSTVRPEGAV